MSYKSHDDLHGLSYCYEADLFKILHCEQLTAIPLPCQLLQPIKLNQWSGEKNQVRGMGNCIFSTSLFNLSDMGWLFMFHTVFFFFLLKWAFSSPSTLSLILSCPFLCISVSVILSESPVKIWSWDFYVYMALSLSLFFSFFFTIWGCRQ